MGEGCVACFSTSHELCYRDEEMGRCGSGLVPGVLGNGWYIGFRIYSASHYEHADGMMLLYNPVERLIAFESYGHSSCNYTEETELLDAYDTYTYDDIWHRVQAGYAFSKIFADRPVHPDDFDHGAYETFRTFIRAWRKNWFRDDIHTDHFYYFAIKGHWLHKAKRGYSDHTIAYLEQFV